VQLKWSVHTDRLTMPVRGPEGWWIAKLPDRSVASLSENEYATMCWLRRAGFDVPAVDLMPAKHIPVIPVGFAAPDELIYLVQRFDRTPGGRVHVEDFAQLADVAPADKYGTRGISYDTMGLAIRHLIGERGLLAYLGRLAAAVLVGNTDAHLKNWALSYPDGRSPELAPVYDFHSLTVYGSRFRYARLALDLAGEQRLPAQVTVDHFRRLAETAGGDPALAVDAVATTVSRLRTAWHDGVGDEIRALSPVLAEHYERRLVELPLARIG